MPKVIKKGVVTGETKTYETDLKCKNCNGDIKSTDTMCPRCGSARPAQYSHGDVKETRVEIKDEKLKRVKAGADNCPSCGSINWEHDKEQNNGACTQCGYNVSKKTDYELAGGPAETYTTPQPKSTHAYTPVHTSIKENNQIKPWMYVAGVVVLLLCGFFTWALTTTHEVRGHVANVEWQITAHQEELILKNGEGFNPPPQATITSTSQEIADWTPNQISETYGEYYVTTTPQQVGHTHGDDVSVETPGAIYTTEPYDCGEPTMEAGGSVTYDQCVDYIQEDSTWGYEESPETPVYAPQVEILQTTMPTPVYGTPTPIYQTYYYYTYWEWTNTGTLDPSYGYNNQPYLPSGQVDEYHRIVVDTQNYKVVIKFDNGEEKVYEGSDPELLIKYTLGQAIVGHFNIFGFLNYEEPYIPE